MKRFYCALFLFVAACFPGIGTTIVGTNYDYAGNRLIAPMMVTPRTDNTRIPGGLALRTPLPVKTTNGVYAFTVVPGNYQATVAGITWPFTAPDSASAILMTDLIATNSVQLVGKTYVDLQIYSLSNSFAGGISVDTNSVDMAVSNTVSRMAGNYLSATNGVGTGLVLTTDYSNNALQWKLGNVIDGTRGQIDLDGITMGDTYGYQMQVSARGITSIRPDMQFGPGITNFYIGYNGDAHFAGNLLVDGTNNLVITNNASDGNILTSDNVGKISLRAPNYATTAQLAATNAALGSAITAYMGSAITTANNHSDSSVSSLSNAVSNNIASVSNSILTQLNSSISIVTNGVWLTDSNLLACVAGECFQFLSIQRDANSVATNASVLWPDGTRGVFVATSVNASWLSVDSFTITYTNRAKTITQSSVSRDATGAVTNKPALAIN